MDLYAESNHNLLPEIFLKKSKENCIYQAWNMFSNQKFAEKITFAVGSACSWQLLVMCSMSHRDIGLATLYHQISLNAKFVLYKEIVTSKWHNKWVVHSLIIMKHNKYTASEWSREHVVKLQDACLVWVCHKLLQDPIIQKMKLHKKLLPSSIWLVWLSLILRKFVCVMEHIPGG